MSSRLTRLAIWWLERQWETKQRPDTDELPWIDASNRPRIVLPPCVIEPPGMMIETEPHVMPDGDPLRALATWGRVGDDHYLLGAEVEF